MTNNNIKVKKPNSVKKPLVNKKNIRRKTVSVKKPVVNKKNIRRKTVSVKKPTSVKKTTSVNTKRIRKSNTVKSRKTSNKKIGGRNYSPILFEIDRNNSNNRIMNNLKIIQLGFSPLSGYEPNYEPSKWNLKPHIKNNHNCYSYALNDKHGKRKGKAQPGYYANYPPINLKEYNCDSIFKRIWKDNPSIYPTLFTNKCNKGYYKAFFTLSPKNHTDYHFYRQDKNGFWSHKPGRTDVTNKDADGKKIINPTKSNRNYGSLNYYMPCQFFCLHPKMTRTHSKSSHNRY